MKEFQSKMQSIFPAIPKNSESSVEWEDLLKSKWKTQSHLEMALPARTGVEVAEVSPLEKQRLRLSKLLTECTEPGNASWHPGGRDFKPNHLYCTFQHVWYSWFMRKWTLQDKLDSSGKKIFSKT